jgi:heme/copper-type cytochrome/quinol oxidase subunit 4
MKTIIAIIASVVPSVAFAITPITDINGVSSKALGIGNVFTYLLVALAVIYIVWNVVFYLIRPSSEDKKAAGMNILYGIVGLFVIVSIWGLVNIFTNSFATTPTNSKIPNLGQQPGEGGIPANQVPTVN